MDKKPIFEPEYVKESGGVNPFTFILIVVLLLLILLLSCNDDTQDTEQIPNIKGTWYSEVIGTPMGNGFAETKIELYNTTYLFHSHTIMGELNQQGTYNYDGDKIRLELSFPTDPFQLLGKSGSEWQVTLDEQAGLMLWENTQNSHSIIWTKSLTGF